MKQVYHEEGSRPIKIWTDDIEAEALQQAKNLARLPFIAGNGVALMPDVHAGKGSTIGSVIATDKVVIPATVGVDLGCGMVAVRLSLKASDLPESLTAIRHQIERDVPLGAGVGHQRQQAKDANLDLLPIMPSDRIQDYLADEIVGSMPKLFDKISAQLGTLGSGNHFIELCLDENQDVWIMLHSGSRGIGNMIGMHFIEKAKREMERWHIHLPDTDLAYLPEGSQHFDNYMEAVDWAQQYAFMNRKVMMSAVLAALHRHIEKPFIVTSEAINCFAGETMVMTRSGNKRISELSGGEHDLLTEGGKWVKAPVKSFGQQNLMEITLSRSGVIKKIRATAGHRWLLHNVQRLQSEVTTAELKKGNRLRSAFPCAMQVPIEKYAVARGFVFGDGSVMHGKSCACFCGTKDEALLPFFDGLKKPFQYNGYKKITCLPESWKKEFPSLDSPASVLLGWIAGYFAADGDVDKTGRPTIASSKREHLEYVRMLCTTIGIGTFGIRSRMRKGYGKEPTELFMMGLMRGDLSESFFIIKSHRDRFSSGNNVSERRSWNVVSVKETSDVEEVFCAVVDGTHSFALEDNILTGNCHHNYVEMENHFGRNLWITRKGAIRAREGDLGIIPGSMGQRSYIVRGKGNAESYCSCSHGAGRRMSRTAARKQFTIADLKAQTEGVDCRKDDAVLDEIPGAYKDIDTVMANQADLVEVVHTLKQIMCVKGA